MLLLFYLNNFLYNKNDHIAVYALIKFQYEGDHHLFHRASLSFVSFPFLKAVKLISDVDDNKILELADECLTDFVITGKTTDFTFPLYKQTKIVIPKEYWANYLPD